MRHIIWFSCGAASAITAYLVLQEFPEGELVYCDTGGEHPDNKRFLSDVERWLNTKVMILKNEKYKDHFEVFEKRKFINSPHGAPCTGELKKELRHKYQKYDDIQYFGYTLEERKKRAAKFLKLFPEVNARFPLIEHGIDKKQCVGIIREAGIKVPVMYKLGYNNNNCIGCVKGGKGYWNKIRNDFPEQFNRMAQLERGIGATAINGVFLDELNPKAGRKKDLIIDCDFTCSNFLTKQKGVDNEEV